MFQGTDSLFFDETPILRATISDLSQQSIERLIKDVQTRGLDVADIPTLKAGVHVLRNPAVYNILLKIGMVTDAGSGIPRMIRLVREAVGREMEFQLSPGEFTVSIPRPIYSRA